MLTQVYGVVLEVVLKVFYSIYSVHIGQSNELNDDELILSVINAMLISKYKPKLLNQSNKLCFSYTINRILSDCPLPTIRLLTGQYPLFAC